MWQLFCILMKIISNFLTDAILKLARVFLEVSQSDHGTVTLQDGRVVASKILWRWKPRAFEPSSPSDFLLWKPRPAPLSELLTADVTLYCVTSDVAIFVKCKDGVDVFNSKVSPFYYLAQLHNACEVYTVSMESFHKLAKIGGDCRVPVTWLSNTGRCGSTMLVQVMEKVPGVLCVSEPDYILNIALKKSAGEIPHDKIRFLLENAVRVMVQNAQLQNLEDGGKVQHVVVKTRAECYSLMEDLHTLFPEHTHVFMNREIFATIQSYRTLLKQHPSLAFRLADSDLVAAFTGAFRQNLFNYCFFPTLEDKAVVSDLVPHLSVAGILSATTACQMSATEKLQKKGLPIYHLSYDELMEDPRRVVTGLFQRLGLSEDHVTRALRAMEVRSQRAVLPAVATEKLTEKDVCDIARVMGRYQVNVDNGR